MEIKSLIQKIPVFLLWQNTTLPIILLWTGDSWHKILKRKKLKYLEFNVEIRLLIMKVMVNSQWEISMSIFQIKHLVRSLIWMIFNRYWIWFLQYLLKKVVEWNNLNSLLRKWSKTTDYTEIWKTWYKTYWLFLKVNTRNTLQIVTKGWRSW